MKSGASRLFVLHPDPYDESASTRNIRICLFRDVANASELRKELRDGTIDAAMIRAELIIEPFTLLAAANRALHAELHNRLSTRSLHAELIYSLSPNRNIADSLITFGIAETSHNLLVAIFDDEKGEKMMTVAKKIQGRPVVFEQLHNITDYKMVKKIYHVEEPDLNRESISDAIITRLVTKDYTS